MSAIDQYLKNNEDYAATRFPGLLPRSPAKHIAVITCMDSRMDIYAVLGLQPGDAHVIRNAGGIVTDAEIRSLAISQCVLGTSEVILVHHTDCGLLKLTGDVFKEQIQSDAGFKPSWVEPSFNDLAADVRSSIARVKLCSLLPNRSMVRGFIYDVRSGRLNEVT
ncbi:carbonic anhydrase [Kitasatospora sp. RB6PN24]|uniref:beta-class carbonic anhydrase n=1 Tax=Kitasatospora humi TaxID=2893891 RepID=UPI001E403682|nr:carbonic anhydrase [Kitasatospora humi]MCC9310991.1 carbonic anhydrase [Kitasatospora humi]